MARVRWVNWGKPGKESIEKGYKTSWSGGTTIGDAEIGAVLFSFRMPVADFLMQLTWSPNWNRLTDVGLLDSVQIYHVWQSTGGLIACAKECRIMRGLTSEERQQFGLL